MTQIVIYIDEITTLDFFKKFKLEHYVYLYFWIFKRKYLYRSENKNFTGFCTDFMQSEVSMIMCNNRDACFSGVTCELFSKYIKQMLWKL